MAEYRFNAAYVEGSGTLSLNSNPYGGGIVFIEEGTTVTLQANVSGGFFFINFNANNGFIVSTDNPWTFTMPARDIRVAVRASGTPAPIDDYGLKYESSFCDTEGKNYKLQIWEDGYALASEEKKSANVVFSFGRFGGNELDTIVNTSLDFSLIGLRNEFDEMLDGGFRKWQVRVLRDDVLFWKGYVNNSILSKKIVGYEQPIRFTASDGLNGWEGVRTVDSFFTGFGGNLSGSLISMVQQTFKDKRPVNIGCDIYETRMDTNEGVFEQLAIPPNAIYTQGNIPEFTGDTIVTLNTGLPIRDAVQNILRPFLCRVFLWENEFYVISIPELNKGSYRLFKYNEDGTFDETDTISIGADISCGFTDAIENARSVKTEFTAVLELGVLDFSSRGGVYENSFGIDNWFQQSVVSPYAGVLTLNRWIYVSSIPSNQPDSYPTGTNPAKIQYVSDSFGERVKIWGTTSSDGLDDTAISYLEIDQFRTGQDIGVAQELANKISFSIRYLCELRNDSSPAPTDNQKCGIMLRIGDKWLDYDESTNTFDWEDSETIMLFPIPLVNAWNTVEIVDLVVPTTGRFTLRLYEVITTGNVDQHTISFQNLSLKIEENESFTLSDIVAKFITDESYSNVDDEYRIKIGDVGTANSSSALRLIDPINFNPFTELWSRDGVEEVPLIRILLQEIANVRGEPNPRIILTLLRKDGDPFDIKPYQNIEFEGFYWMVNAIEIDFVKDFWKIEIIKMGAI